MRPNENFRKYFSDVEVPEEAEDTGRSSCLKAGTYMVIKKTVKDLELDKKLEDIFGTKAAGIILDFASYSIITEGNAAQYYPDYAYNHPLFTPDMKIYSYSTITDFFRSLDENQRQAFFDLSREASRERRELLQLQNISLLSTLLRISLRKLRLITL